MPMISHWWVILPFMICRLVIYPFRMFINSSLGESSIFLAFPIALSVLASSSFESSSSLVMEWSRIRPWASCSLICCSLMWNNGYFLPLTVNISSTISFFLNTNRLYCFGSKASPSLRRPCSISVFMLFLKFSFELGTGTDISPPTN